MTDLPSRTTRPGESRLNLPLAAVVIGVLIMSTGLVAIQASDMTGVQFSFWRLWAAVVAIGAVVLVRAVWFGVRPPLSSLRWAVWPGLFLGFSQPVLFTAMKLTSVADVVLLASLLPLLVSVIAIPILGERPGNRFRLWAVLAVIGAGMVVYGGSTGLEGNPAGMALAGVSLIGWALYLVYLKIARMHLDTLVLLWSVFAIGAVAVTAYMAVTGWDIGPVTNRDWLLVVYETVMAGGIGLILLTWSFRWLPANIPPLVLRVEPLVASGLAWWLLAEPITLMHFVGGGIALTGVVGAILSPSGQRLMADERAKANLSEGN